MHKLLASPISGVRVWTDKQRDVIMLLRILEIERNLDRHKALDCPVGDEPTHLYAGIERLPVGALEILLDIEYDSVLSGFELPGLKKRGTSAVLIGLTA